MISISMESFFLFIYQNINYLHLMINQKTKSLVYLVIIHHFVQVLSHFQTKIVIVP